MIAPVTIIAEAAQGYDGDVTLARLLVRAAAAGRADAVKFQVIYADDLATPVYAYHGLFKTLEMSQSAWDAVGSEAKDRGIGLVCDVFGPRSLEVALALRADAVKLHSTDFFNRPLAEMAIARAPHVYFSAGGLEVDEIDAWLGRAGSVALDRLTMLYGFQAEPTPAGDNNLARLATLRARFPGLRLGFMDHTAGADDDAGWLGTLALPFGVSVIEKHITLERSLQLEDYVSAATPTEFAAYVRRIRAAEAALGSAELTLSGAERGYRDRALKAVVATRALGEGTVLTVADIALLRTQLPEQGEVLRRPEDAVGRRLVRPRAAGEALVAEDLKP
jgi:N,N'-diacetyllegionaminate synthase